MVEKMKLVSFTQFPIRFLWLKYLVIYKYFTLDYVALPFVLKECYLTKCIHTKFNINTAYYNIVIKLTNWNKLNKLHHHRNYNA